MKNWKRILISAGMVIGSIVLATYLPTDTLKIDQSGTAQNPLIYDGQGQTVKCIVITSSYVEVRNFVVEGCATHGIWMEGVGAHHILVENNTVHNAEYDRLNEDGNGCDGPGGWGSGIKGRNGANHLTIRGNTVYENCGEGIAVTRNSNVLIENNIVYDNFSVNIYSDNSNNVVIRNNAVYCTGIFLREGRRPSGIVSAEEDYGSVWGTQRHDTHILTNSIDGCFFGISSWDSELSTGREINLLVKGNTIKNTTGTPNSIKLEENLNVNVIVRNNITDKRIYAVYPIGVTLSGNTIDTVNYLQPQRRHQRLQELSQ